MYPRIYACMEHIVVLVIERPFARGLVLCWNICVLVFLVYNKFIRLRVFTSASNDKLAVYQTMPLRIPTHFGRVLPAVPAVSIARGNKDYWSHLTAHELSLNRRTFAGSNASCTA